MMYFTKTLVIIISIVSILVNLPHALSGNLWSILVIIILIFAIIISIITNKELW